MPVTIDEVTAETPPELPTPAPPPTARPAAPTPADLRRQRELAERPRQRSARVSAD